MSLNRLGAGGAALAAFWLLGDPQLFAAWSVPIMVWLILAAGISLHVFVNRSHAGVTRGLALALDILGATLIVWSGSPGTAFAYVAYLWVIVGYGFRFGAAWMGAASLLSITGFGAVCLADPFWRDHTSLSLGLLSALAVIPAYSYILIRQIDQARAEAQRANHAKSLFLAGVSHELRTPLQAIIGMAEGLQETPLSPEQRGMVTTVNTAAEGQLSLVQDLLEYARLDAGHGHSTKAAIDLCALLEDVTAVSGAAARGKGLHISYHVSARTPLSLIGDRRRVREVLINLCSNAVKFTSAGSVIVAADGVVRDGGGVHLRFEVMDTGIGIHKKDQRRIFELFTQTEAGRLGHHGGTGLGLALCERQVRLMGGEIGVDSALGRGSTFWFTVDLVCAEEPAEAVAPLVVTTLPGSPDWTRALAERLGGEDAPGAPRPGAVLVDDVARLASVPPANAAIYVTSTAPAGLPPREVRERCVTAVGCNSAPSHLARALTIAATWASRHQHHAGQGLPPPMVAFSPELAGIRVLVADDNRVNRLILQQMLDRAGAVVVMASDGEQALELLTAGGVDMALLDVNMPGMDAVEVAQFYGFTAPIGGHIPLIALTADSSPETGARCLQAGIRRCLLKPIRSEELLAALAAELPPPTPKPIRVAHPTTNTGSALDPEVLRSLRSLVGPEALAHLVGEFKQDGVAAVSRIEAALAEVDVERFRYEAHGLGSVAANMGARTLSSLCSAWSRLPEREIASAPWTMPPQLRREWDRTCAELDQHGCVPAVGGR